MIFRRCVAKQGKKAGVGLKMIIRYSASQGMSGTKIMSDG